MSRFARIATLLLLVAVVAGVWFLCRAPRHAWRPSAPELTTPQLTLAVLRGPKTFFNGPARAAMERERAAFIPEPARDGKSEFSRGMTQAVQDARLFRELDRQVRFDELWLLGDPSSYKPLLDHLLETRDFVLVSIDHTSLVFRHEGEPWSQAHLDALAARFADPRERAYVQALAAAKLIAVRQSEPALKLLQAAESASKDVPEVWSGWSAYRMTKGEWDKALEAAKKALALESDFLPGIACRAQCFYAKKRFYPAWKEAERLLAAQPDDPAMLFYHAKLSHEARAFQAETASLLRLIELAGQAKANVSGYRVYLAQSYAAANDADNAMDQVTLALLDTTLPREQRQFADELLQQLKRASASSGR
jgi:tetratricopeptide (TPR) repeat protein